MSFGNAIDSRCGLSRGCRRGLCGGLLLLAVLIGATVIYSESAAADLRSQLRELSSTHGFSIQGLGLIASQPARPVAGEIRHQIKYLLASYNYVVVDNERGDIDKVILLARGQDGSLPQTEITTVYTVGSPGEHIIPARRKGSHQVVDAILMGPGQAPVPVSLMVDTGASTVVLPVSMIAVLGIDVEDLRDGWTQTANGRVRAKMGTLTSVDIGSVLVHDVAVTFLDDQKLGGNRLLGMSFLQGFRMTIDDANKRIILSDQ